MRAVDLTFKPQGGGSHGPSPLRADAFALYTWWHEFIKRGEGPRLKDVCNGLGWHRSRVVKVVNFIILRRGRSSLPHLDAYKATVLDGRCRWRGALCRWAPAGSEPWYVYHYCCRECGHHRARIRQEDGVSRCLSCRAAQSFDKFSGEEIDRTDLPDVQIERGQQISRMLAAIDNLPSPRHAEVIRARFGLNGGDGELLEVIGQRMGISRERVRQIETLALANLRRQLKNESPPT